MTITRALQGALVIPVFITGFTVLYVSISDPGARSPIIAVAGMIYIGCSLVEVVAVPVALIRLIQNKECRSISNAIYVLLGGGLLAPFIFIYVWMMING